MTAHRLVPFLLLGACTAGPPATQPSAGTERSADPARVLLAAHNRERAAVRVRPLAWDPGLARAAGLYARQLAVLGTLRHSPRSARPGQGENLWMGTRGAFAHQELAQGRAPAAKPLGEAAFDGAGHGIFSARATPSCKTV